MSRSRPDLSWAGIDDGDPANDPPEVREYAATRGGSAGPTGPKSAANPPTDPFDAGMRLSDLVRAELPDVAYVLAGVVPEGLTVLAGRPKSGKSWIGMQLAICVASAAPCLGSGACVARPVLHLALEDTRRRYRDRAKMQLGALRLAAPSDLEVRTNWPRAGSGGLTRLAEWYADHRGGLVVIDTLARFRDPQSGRGSSYDTDYDAIASVKALADRHEGAALVIHHTRKAVADDPFDEVSGTLGINGAADGLLVLDRQRGADNAALYATGRDLPETTITLSWSGSKGVWSLLSRADGIERPDRTSAPNKVGRCATWLRFCLTTFAFPDGELAKGAERNDYTAEDVKRAKAMLRKESPPLRAKARGFGGEWWNWIGDDVPDRTEAARRELLGETAETTETGAA